MAGEPFFNEWCDIVDETVGAHRLRVLTEKNGARDSITQALDACVVDHYDDTARLERWATALGLPNAASVLREVLPTESRAQSGHIGEVLLTESIPELFPGFIVPLKRLRWIDGRNMALRGEDFIGLDNRGRQVKFLKAEAKSRARLSTDVVTEARQALKSNNGRPSAHAMLYLARRLDEIGRQDLSAIFLQYALRSPIEDGQLVHVLFTFTGNDSSGFLRTDLTAHTGTIEQHAVGLVVRDHQDFILAIYTRLTNAT